MPEYLSPGVYVEEVSFRSKSIEGVPTSTTGFAGLTRTGPVQYVVDSTSLRGPDVTEPRLITSFTEFERVYGGLDPMTVGGDERIPYLAHAARAFFMNGGSRLYVARVFSPVDTDTDANWGIATRPVSVNSTPVTQAVWRARWPGAFGNVLVDRDRETRQERRVHRRRPDPGEGHARRRARRGRSGRGHDPPRRRRPAERQRPPHRPHRPDHRAADCSRTTPGTRRAHGRRSSRPVLLQVIVRAEDSRLDVYGELGVDPADRRYIGRILQKNDPEDEDAIVWLDYGGYDPQDLTRAGFADNNASPIDLAVALQGELDAAARRRRRRQHAAPGRRPAVARGAAGRSRPPRVKATGLEALGEIDDIAIVALPDGGTYDDDETSASRPASALITHAERLRYRIAVVDAPQQQLDDRDPRVPRPLRLARTRALYHPWIEILDPTGAARPGSAAAAAAAPAVGLRDRDLRPQRHHSAASSRRRRTRSSRA